MSAKQLARSVAAKMRDLSGSKLTCSFCRRSESEVARLVSGSSAYICDSCIAECVAVLKRHGGFDRPAPTQPN